MRLLMYGTGVIGSLYAVKFSNAGYDVTVLARGKRLQSLKEHGLQYKDGEKIKMAQVCVIDLLKDDDHYDFIFLPVQTKQAEIALKQMSKNCSPNIVTMVNTMKDIQEWEGICGTGKLIPAFPGES